MGKEEILFFFPSSPLPPLERRPFFFSFFSISKRVAKSSPPFFSHSAPLENTRPAFFILFFSLPPLLPLSLEIFQQRTGWLFPFLPPLLFQFSFLKRLRSRLRFSLSFLLGRGEKSRSIGDGSFFPFFFFFPLFTLPFPFVADRPFPFFSPFF